MAQNGATFGTTFLDKEKYGTAFEAIRKQSCKKNIKSCIKDTTATPVLSIADVSKKKGY